MSTNDAIVRKVFRITVDVESEIKSESLTDEEESPRHFHHYQALVKQLLKHPVITEQLLRSLAVGSIGQAKNLLEQEYGWGRNSEQKLLQPIIEELDSDSQAYFVEELDDGSKFYYFDGYAASIKRFSVTELVQL